MGDGAENGRGIRSWENVGIQICDHRVRVGKGTGQSRDVYDEFMRVRLTVQEGDHPKAERREKYPAVLSSDEGEAFRKAGADQEQDRSDVPKSEKN